jgi:hypothetical protein
MTTSSHMRPRNVVLAGIAAAAAGVAILLLVGSSRPSAAASPDPSRAATFSSLAPATAATLDVRAKRVLTGVAGDLAVTAAAPANTSATGAATTLVRASGAADTCLITALADGSGAVACGASSRLRATDVTAGLTFTSGGYVVSGIVPDGIASVRVETKAGGELPAAIHGNTYAVPVAAAPAGVVWTDGQGVVHRHALIDPSVVPPSS